MVTAHAKKIGKAVKKFQYLNIESHYLPKFFVVLRFSSSHVLIHIDSEYLITKKNLKFKST